MFVGAASDKLQSCLQVILCVLVNGSLLLNVSVLPQRWGGGGGGVEGRRGRGSVSILGCCCCFSHPFR